MNNYRSIVSKIRGPLVPILPAFHQDESLDINSTCRWVDWLIRQGIRLFWTTYGTSHYFCLSDAEIMEFNRALAQVIAGRATFIASTNFHWSVRQCRDFIQQAQEWGVDIVKIQINWAFNPSEEQVFEFYRRVAENSPLPLFAYSLAVPGVSSGVSLGLLQQILTLPQFVGMKNDKDDFYGEADYLRVIRKQLDPAEFVVMTGGTMSSYLFGYDFGARAFTDTVAWYAPSVSLRFNQCLDDGNRHEAVRIIKEWQEPMWEQWKYPGADWDWIRAVLLLMSHFHSNATRFPFRTLQGKEIEDVRQFLQEKGVLS